MGTKPPGVSKQLFATLILAFRKPIQNSAGRHTLTSHTTNAMKPPRRARCSSVVLQWWGLKHGKSLCGENRSGEPLIYRKSPN